MTSRHIYISRLYWTTGRIAIGLGLYATWAMPRDTDWGDIATGSGRSLGRAVHVRKKWWCSSQDADRATGVNHEPQRRPRRRWHTAGAAYGSCTASETRPMHRSRPNNAQIKASLLGLYYRKSRPIYELSKVHVAMRGSPRLTRKGGAHLWWARCYTVSAYIGLRASFHAPLFRKS